jgi:hypothetical protein
MVKNLQVYQENDRGTYKGISRAFFPKWIGWKLLEEGGKDEELQKAVEDFYMTYFFYQMKLDLIEDKTSQFLLFNFVTAHGKKKGISKLQKATNSHLESTALIEEFNYQGAEAILKLKLELLEFYYYIDRPELGAWVLTQ